MGSSKTSTVPPGHEVEVDEEDESVKQLKQCAQLYLNLQASLLFLTAWSTLIGTGGLANQHLSIGKLSLFPMSTMRISIENAITILPKLEDHSNDNGERDS
eukprot:Gb_08981 [translate_table: standard]